MRQGPRIYATDESEKEELRARIAELESKLAAVEKERDEAVLAEREACAKACEAILERHAIAAYLAAAIRARAKEGRSDT